MLPTIVLLLSTKSPNILWTGIKNYKLLVSAKKILKRHKILVVNVLCKKIDDGSKAHRLEAITY